MTPRGILMALIRRLEPIAGHLHELDYTAWESEVDDLNDRAARGLLHLHTALDEARKAIASGNAATIAQAALICPTFERTGLQLRSAHPRRAGGKRRGADQQAAAGAAWAPYRAQYRDLLAKGTKPDVARRLVKAAMTKAGFVARSGAFPTDRTIRAQLQK